MVLENVFGRFIDSLWFMDFDKGVYEKFLDMCMSFVV